MRNHALKNESTLSHLSAWANGLLDRFYALCRTWMSHQVAHPDEENWWAMWYPKSFSLTV